jgi:hypothetical protein
MNCPDVRDMADSFLNQELLTETNHDILRHLDACPLCRTEIDARRRLRVALRDAFNRAPELQPSTEFRNRLHDHMRQAARQPTRRWSRSTPWLAVAAGVLLAVGVTGTVLMKRSVIAVEALARDAVGDHQNCALQYRLAQRPVSLEEAALQFDSAYRQLLTAPPDEISTPEGTARVTERHSCAYGAHRFGHVIMEYRGRVVSLLMTADDGSGNAGEDAIPHAIGRPTDGLSVVSVNGTRHAVLLVSDLESTELARLAAAVSVPLARGLSSRHVLPAGQPGPPPSSRVSDGKDRPERKGEHAVLGRPRDGVLTLSRNLPGQFTSLRLAHRLASLAHANRGHGVEAREQSAVCELNVMSERPRRDVTEPGLDQHPFQRVHISETVARIDNRTHVPLDNRIQFAHLREILEGRPRRDRRPSAGCEYAVHFANRRRLVGHELQALVTAQHREPLGGFYRKGGRVPLTPVDGPVDGARDRQHRWCDVDADNPRLAAKPLTRHPSDDAGTARDVDEAVAGLRRQARNQLLRERPEQRTDQDTLVDFGERRRHEQLCL